jgi:hypothetical protein
MLLFGGILEAAAELGMGGLNQHMRALACDRPLRLTPPNSATT